MPAPSELSVTCPGCGGTTVDHGRGHHPSRYRCVHHGCPFHRGWRLELAAHHEQLAEQDGGDTVYAVPVTAEGDLLLDDAVQWPSVLAAWARAA